MVKAVRKIAYSVIAAMMLMACSTKDISSGSTPDTIGGITKRVTEHYSKAFRRFMIVYDNGISGSEDVYPGDGSVRIGEFIINDNTRNVLEIYFKSASEMIKDSISAPVFEGATKDNWTLFYSYTAEALLKSYVNQFHELDSDSDKSLTIDDAINGVRFREFLDLYFPETYRIEFQADSLYDFKA